jgi:hypothetical protein
MINWKDLERNGRYQIEVPSLHPSRGSNQVYCGGGLRALLLYQPIYYERYSLEQSQYVLCIEHHNPEVKKQEQPVVKKPKLLGKPFGQLLEGVTLVISGYQNPHRANLRAMALEMGACYKSDWDTSCTHLV